MPSDKSLEAMEAVFVPRLSKRAHDYCDTAAEVADRLVAEAVTEERQRILEELGTQGDGISVQTSWVRAIVNGTDQQ